MKSQLILLTLLAAAVSGCLEADTDDLAAPDVTGVASFESVQPNVVSGLEPLTQMLNAAGESVNGAGIWPYGDYVFGSGLGVGFWIADISDPENPVMIYQSPEDSETDFARDADVVEHADGRLTLVLATQSDGMHVWDVTSPAEPVFRARVEVDPNHNVATVPGTTYVFNSQSGGYGRSNDLVDVSDPANPVVLGTYGAYGCHDIAFFGDLGGDKFRAYCAGIDRTEIWSLDGFNASAENFGIELVSFIGCPVLDADAPRDDLAAEVASCASQSPVVGSPVFGSSPTRTLHHLAMVNNDATILIVGDEFNGGGTPGACFAHVQGAVPSTSTPLGALWFYDISDESEPELLSWLSPPTVAPGVPSNPQSPLSAVPNCTAHFGQVIPGEEKLVMAWYTAGIVLVDFSDPAEPVILKGLALEGSNVWDARVHHGYVLTGDIIRGMDVYQLV